MKTTTTILAILLCLMLPVAGYATEKPQTPAEIILIDDDVKAVFDAFYTYLYTHKKSAATIGTKVCLKDLVDAGLLPKSFISDESKTKDALIVIGKHYERGFYVRGCEGLNHDTSAELKAPFHELPENKFLSEEDATALRSVLERLSYSPLAIERGDQAMLMSTLIVMVDLKSRFDIKYGKKAQNELTFFNSSIDTLKQHFMFTATLVHSQHVKTPNVSDR